MNNNISFRPLQQCKKDKSSLKYENVIKERNNINIYKNEKKNEEKNEEKSLKKNIKTKSYNKTEFLDEFNKLHDDIYFNPYKILDIEKDYTPEILKKQYRKLALKYHPDKETGNINKFKDITQSYLYLLKKYKENIPDKQIYELKNEFDNYIINENKSQNILLNNEKFNIDNFNKIYDEYNINDNDDGYGDFMKSGKKEEKIETENYIFSNDFNINIFNKLFNEKIEKKTTDIQIYKEPDTIIQTSNNFIELGQNKILDYSAPIGNKLNYTDCKKAYSEPEYIDDSNITNFNNLEDLKSHRKNIKYDMDELEKIKYNNYLKLKEENENNRLQYIENEDINIFKKYKEINKVLIQK